MMIISKSDFAFGYAPLLEECGWLAMMASSGTEADGEKCLIDPVTGQNSTEILLSLSPMFKYEYLVLVPKKEIWLWVGRRMFYVHSSRTESFALIVDVTLSFTNVRGVGEKPCVWPLSHASLVNAPRIIKPGPVATMCIILE
jgi:hypothetical protein